MDGGHSLLKGRPGHARKRSFGPMLMVLLLACWVLFGVNARAADLVPYLQTPGATSMWVSWKTSTSGSSVVEYGTAPNALTQTATGKAAQQLAGNYFFHGVQVQGLVPDSYYHYRIRTGNQVSPVYRFRTQPASTTTSGKYRILVVGDHQIRDQNRHGVLLERARAKLEAEYGRPLEEIVNIMVNDGDQVDVGTLDHWENLHFAQSAPMSKNIPIMTTIGNHETYYDPGMVNWKAHFFRENLYYKNHAPGPDERYYANHVGRVLFIHLDSEATSNTQRDWVQAVINTASTDPEVDWVISVIHRPYQAEQYVGDISIWLRTQVMPILSSTRKHVLNIAGHHHLYARGQARDVPTYHLISGGTAWDQYWGQSTEKDFDDVQKTIANWTWQLIEIDVATKEMSVRSFSEAHPKLGFVYPSKLTDEFHRKLNHGAPAKPVFINNVSGAVNLPLKLSSGPFASAYGEALNTTQFQIARDASFASVVLESVRDVSNLYGDTGAPFYEPVDINAGVDILSFEIAALGLPNGSYYARLRHRDTNVEWSPWSEAVNFTVQGSSSGSPSLSLNKKAYAPTEAVRVQYVNSTGNPKDWVGIYRRGQVPGNVGSTQFSYVSGLNGTAVFNGLPAGVEYYAAFFTNDTYTEIAPRVPFYVGKLPSLSVNKTALAVGEAVVFLWSNAQTAAGERIQLYRVGQTPGAVAAVQSQAVNTGSGSASFSGLPKGYYFASYTVGDASFEVIERIAFSVGDRIGTVEMPNTALAVGAPFSIRFADGPGIPKDYLGVFKLGAVPGVDQLVSYYYVGGQAQGTVNVTDTLAEGSYFVALFINDSYTEVSNRVNFTVGNASLPPTPPSFMLDKGQYLDSEALTLSWSNTSGNPQDYAAVFRAGDTPGAATPLRRGTLAGTAGSLSFAALPPGSYFAGLFSTGTGGNTTELASRLPFKVVKLGDLNGDGRVDLADREVLRGALGSCVGSPRFLLAANFDSDTCITQQDYKLWYDLYTRQLTSAKKN